MLPDRVSNPGPVTYESGALPKKNKHEISDTFDILSEIVSLSSPKMLWALIFC